ncbi:hypothetical protein M9H77_17495 [Catharanthus roseus]|uniref:Uncharacterized protein n=1 Tax=Catharanthus roseus TaxID=4058 RepID=A0ACC0B505_CATRO|nr:hypothetical protein M9H77_17495 [Catharanthus roseus]
MKYWGSLEYKAFNERNKRNRNERQGVGERESTQQADLTKRFSKSRHSEELHKHQSGDKKGRYVDFHSEDFWRIVRRAETVVSYVFAAFDKQMREFAEQSHLPYTTMPPMMDIVRATIVVIPSTSSSTEAVPRTSDARVSSSTLPPPSIDALGTNTVDPPPLLAL